MNITGIPSLVYIVGDKLQVKQLPNQTTETNILYTDASGNISKGTTPAYSTQTANVTFNGCGTSFVAALVYTKLGNLNFVQFPDIPATNIVTNGQFFGTAPAFITLPTFEVTAVSQQYNNNLQDWLFSTEINGAGQIIIKNISKGAGDEIVLTNFIAGNTINPATVNLFWIT